MREDLCPLDMAQAKVSLDNYKKLKKIMKEFELDTVDGMSMSYREYCKLFRNLKTIQKKCNGKICCQAITEDGKRCKRSASKFFSVDLTRKKLITKVPDFVKKSIGAKKVAELKLLGFANNCCFYCWQHAGIFVGDKLTYISNFSYYSTHPEDILSVFFDNVQPKKLGFITYSFKELGNIRTPEDIVHEFLGTYSSSQEKTSKGFWIPFIMVMLYDQIKPYIIKIIKGSVAQKEKLTEKMAIVSANVLTMV